MFSWKHHAKPDKTMVTLNFFPIFPSQWKTLGWILLYLDHWDELSSSCCKAIEYLNENTEELI